MSDAIMDRPKRAESPAIQQRAAAREHVKMLHGKVEVGMPLKWWDRGDESHDPYCGQVAAIGDRGLVLLIFNPNGTMQIRDGVMHRLDPDLNVEIKKQSGCWDFPNYLLALLVKPK